MDEKLIVYNLSVFLSENVSGINIVLLNNFFNNLDEQKTFG